MARQGRVSPVAPTEVKTLVMTKGWVALHAESLQEDRACLKRWDLSRDMAVTTRDCLPVAYLCRSRDEDTMPAQARTVSAHVRADAMNHTSDQRRGVCADRVSCLPVTFSVSAAVPAPQQYMLGAMKWIFSQFLSATVDPAVDLVSAPSTMPSCKGDCTEEPEHPTQPLCVLRITATGSTGEHPHLEHDPCNGGSCLGEAWCLNAPLFQKGIAFAQVKLEPRLGFVDPHGHHHKSYLAAATVHLGCC